MRYMKNLYDNQWLININLLYPMLKDFHPRAPDFSLKYGITIANYTIITTNQQWIHKLWQSTTKKKKLKKKKKNKIKIYNKKKPKYEILNKQ